MKQYHDCLQRICDEGIDHSDRTGVGRRSIFGTQDRYKMADGFPLVTSRKIFTKAIVHELLWFIKGSFNAQELKDQGVKIWDLWMVTEDDIMAFAAKYAPEDEEMQAMMREAFKENKLGTIGMMYGAMWRNAPQSIVHTLWPDVLVSDMPSDKLAEWTKEYEELKFVSKEEIPSFEQFIKIKYYSTVDQLNDLVNGLKKRPYSSRHVVTAWIPSHVPFETLSPQENVLMERGALAACHAMFQCFVYPPKDEASKPRLSLMMTIR
jgi:thymidylate synthase